MSRFFLVGSLVAALTSSAFAGQTRFSQPPPATIAAGIRVEAPIVDRAAVRTKLAKQRAANLGRFRAYQQKGEFPSNTYQNKKLNVWIDADGHLCAAATIISASGMQNLVMQVSEDNNFIRLGDVQDGALMDWILTSGLTQAEIAAIQEPFMPVMDEPTEPGPVQITAARREAEDQRLMAKYKLVEKEIVRNQRASLDAATNRLMANPALAAAFMAS